METAPANVLGETVRERRIAAGMTQEQLASESGLSRSTIQSIERGDDRRVNRSTLRLIADALGTDVATLREVA